MRRDKVDKEYLIYEDEMKRKVLVYFNYFCGISTILEFIGSCQARGKIFCWENTLYFYFLPWALYGNRLCAKKMSTNASGFCNAIIHHLCCYHQLFIKNNYIAVIISYIAHFIMRSVWIQNRILSRVDTGLISMFLGLTFHRMLTQLYDKDNNCIWDYDMIKDDLVDSIFRIVCVNAFLYLSDYFTKMRMECLRNMAEEIEEKSKEKERFFACVSHELRNPLNSLLAIVEIYPISPKSKRGELLTTAKSCGENLHHLIGNILDFSKIKDQKIELFLTECDIHELINKVVMMHKIKASNKGLHLELLGDPNIPPCVKADPAKLTQILTNLISNSIKFTENGSVIINLSWKQILQNDYTKEDFEIAIEEAGEISNREEVISMVDEHPIMFRSTTRDLEKKMKTYQAISRINDDNQFTKHLKAHGPCIEYPKGSLIFESARSKYKETAKRRMTTMEKGILKIEIIDTGIGISTENIAKLFQPFAQADKTISQKFGGTGLGLWIAKNITEMMGGNIKVESEIGNGTNFMLILPLFAGNEKLLMEDEILFDIQSVQNEFKGLRVLYVEDICENQMVMTQILQQFGFEIKQAVDGAEGLYQFKKNQIGYFDVILTDLRMPNMSGQTMIMKIREFEKNLKIAKQQQVSIIVLTGDPSENEKSKCLNILEVNEFLVKPVTLYQLNKTFNTIFRREENKREEIEYQEKSIKRVLVIDDDKLLNNLIRQFLDQYEVIQAYSIREGKQKFEENYERIFAVCLDGNLGDGIGPDFLREARKFEREVKKVPDGKLVKVISTSGDPISQQLKIYKHLEVSTFLQKPFSKDALLNSLLHLETQ